MGDNKQQGAAMSSNAPVEPKCGSVFIFQVSTAVCTVVGLIGVIVPIAVGGCECAGTCIYDMTIADAASCTSWFKGCESSFDTAKCVAAVNAASGTTAQKKQTACETSECNMGGLPMGAYWFLVFLGVTGIIMAIVSSCGICACCCFAPEEGTLAPTAAAAAAPMAAPVAAPAVVAPPAAPVEK